VIKLTVCTLKLGYNLNKGYIFFCYSATCCS